MGEQVFDSRAFRQPGQFDYLTDEDRYLSRLPAAQFRYGVIGCGMMGQEHMRNARLAGGARIEGVFDPARASVQHALDRLATYQPDGAPRVYASLEEACSDPATDALIIATPNNTHLDVLRVAVTNKKAIFLEKPIATTAADAAAVCRLLRDHAGVVRIGLQYRHKAIYREAISEVMERQSLGQVRSVSMLEHRFPFLDKVGQWNKFDAHTGGTLVEKCCHYFDLINLFAGGRPTQVFAMGNQAVNFKAFSYREQAADGLDQAQVMISYDNGVIGSFGLCMFVHGSREELTVCGDSGRLHASEQFQLGEPVSNTVELWAGDNGVSKTVTPVYPSYIARAGHHGSTFYEHMEFLDELRSGTNKGPSIAAAFDSVAVGLAAQASIARGEPVPVEEFADER